MSNLIPSQGINLRTPSPVASANLAITGSSGWSYSPDWQGWQFVVGGTAVNFQLTLPQPQAVQLSFVMCCMADGGRTNDPVTLRVNGHTLFAAFEPHEQNFVQYTFYVPAHWLNAGANGLVLSLDGNATTRATFWTFNVAGIATQTTQATSISFETPSPSATDIMSLPLFNGCRYDARYNAWQIAAPGGFMKFNLVLDQPRLVAITMNFCSMSSGGRTNNPFSISVNGQSLLSNYDPHNVDFHDEQWLVPANWTVAGNNTIMLSLSGSATTTVDLKRFGAAAQVLPAQTTPITFAHDSGQLTASWTSMPFATSYEIAFYRGADHTTPVFSTSGFLGLGIVFPGEAQPGDYGVRVRPWTDNVAGAWTDMVSLSLARSIFFLSPSGQQNPGPARLALEDLGIVVYGNADNLHFEGLADAVQLQQAATQAYVLAAYGAALTAAEIAALPANQQPIANQWNYYYSAAYQAVLADTLNENKSWGDELLNSPPVSQTVPPHMLRALVEPELAGAEEGYGVEPLSMAERDQLTQRLEAHLGDVSAAHRLVQSFVSLPAQTRERLFAAELRPHLLGLVDANPKVAMRGEIAVGVIVVQSSMDVGGTPVGWKVKTAINAGAHAIAVEAGTNDPQPGDSFSIGAFAFTVTAWDPLTLTLTTDTAAPSAVAAGTAITTVAAPRKGPCFSAADRAVVVQKVQDAYQGIQTNAPQFRPNGWEAAQAVAAGQVSFQVTGGRTYPRAGDTFTLTGGNIAYTVSQFDMGTSTLHTSAALPALPAGTALTFPDAQNLKLVVQLYDAQINVGYDYNPNDDGNEGDSYWVLPAVAKVQIGGQQFPATWAGLETLRQALQTSTGASGALLLFLSAFPTNWFAFAQSTLQLMVMSRHLRTFKAAYSATVSAQLDARDQASVRTWLDTGGLGEGLSIPAGVSLSITVHEAGRRWSVATQVEQSTTRARYDRSFLVLAVGTPNPSTFAVFQGESWGLPRWNQVMEHETFHLFDVPDEYAGVGTPCSSCEGSYGVYNIPNGNCATCAKPLHQCVMNAAAGKICDYTHATMGWSDVLVEVTTDPTSQNNNDPMWVKLGDGMMFRLSDPIIDDRQPGSRDPYALGYTRISRADVQTIAVGNNNPAEIRTPWKVKRIRVWVQGEVIYDRDNLGATVDAAHSWYFAPGFSGNVSGYSVTITTGDRWFAGTGDNVYITLGGKKLIVNEFVLIDDAPYGGYTGFPTGSVKTTALSPAGIDIANNRTVTLTKELASLLIEPLFGGDDWYPAHIRIVAQRMTGGEVVVLDTDINKWLGLGYGYSWSAQVQNVP
jgi:hypothetical protein